RCQSPIWVGGGLDRGDCCRLPVGPSKIVETCPCKVRVECFLVPLDEGFEHGDVRRVLRDGPRLGRFARPKIFWVFRLIGSWRNEIELTVNWRRRYPGLLCSCGLVLHGQSD